MEKLREYVFRGNAAAISVSLQDHGHGDCFVLAFKRSPDCDIEIAMRPDEALLVSAMLTQAVSMACGSYKIELDTDKHQEYGNLAPKEEIKSSTYCDCCGEGQIYLIADGREHVNCIPKAEQERKHPEWI